MRQEEISSFNESFERYRDRITNFSNEFEFGLFVHILKRSLPIIIGIILIFGIGARLYLRYSVPTFKASVTLQLEKDDQANKILNVGNYMEGNELSSDIELLNSGFMLSRTLDNLELPVRYFEQGKLRGSEHYQNAGYEIRILSVQDSSLAFNEPFFLKSDEVNGFFITHREIEYGPYSATERIDLGFVEMVLLVDNEERMADTELGNQRYFILTRKEALEDEFSKQLKAGILNRNAQTLVISCTNQNPRLAKDLAMAHAHTFLEYDRARKEKSSERILDFIESQLDTVSENLRNAEFLLNSFKQEYKINQLSEVSGVYLDRLNEAEQQLFNLRMSDNLLDEISKVSESETGLDVYNLMAVIVGSEFENNLQQLLSDLGELLREREEMFFDMTEESEYTKSLDYRIEIQKNLIVESINSLQSKNDARREMLQERYSELEAVFSGLPVKELEYARYERLYNINEKYYTNLLERKIEYRISKAGFTTDNKILEEATVPSTPLSPVPNGIYSAFLGLGVLLSILFVGLR
ncbi:MAG: hypothetical protein HKN79_06955, partial [Flavobacteriales bacterium]|nr:hypothetical protein [Flavobacteriales bacterium]